jgi:hypothetical protein
MEPISVIVGLLATGAAARLSEVAGQAVIDAYSYCVTKSVVGAELAPI